MSLSLLSLSWLAVSPVHAQNSNGHYWQITYQNKNTSWSQDNMLGSQYNQVTHYSGTWPSTANSDMEGGYYSVDAQTAGTVTATLTWVPAQGKTLQQDPPPVETTVEETATAFASGGDSSSPPTFSDGLGSRGTDTLYVTEPSSSGTITLSDTVSAATAPAPPPPYTYGNANADASFSVSVAPFTLTIDPVGAVQDTNQNWNILIGQQCSPTLSGIPSGYETSNYQWGVSGTTFQTWQPTTPAVNGNQANSQASYYVGGPGPLNGPNATVKPPIPFPSWYWDEIGNNSSHSETISCTVTLTPPAGQGNPFTASVSQPINVWIPNWTGTGIGGEVRVDTNCPSGNGKNY